MVYDEEGRRRFHGAFTGGFSAGYFNSVGSAEGWTPREFRSSRNQRSDYATQSVEDFMDEEDREALGLGRYLVAREQFRSGSERDPNAMGHSRDENEQKKSLDNDTSQRMLQSVASILRPPLSSMGTQLMRLMGWRPGEGIGSSRRKEAIRLRRLRLAAKKHRHDSERDAERDSARVSSEVFCSVDEGDESDGSLSSEDAREDIEVLFAQGRDNRRGLGYDLHLVAPDVATARDRAFGSEVNSRSTRITIEQMLRNGWKCSSKSFFLLLFFHFFRFIAPSSFSSILFLNIIFVLVRVIGFVPSILYTPLPSPSLLFFFLSAASLVSKYFRKDWNSRVWHWSDGGR